MFSMPDIAVILAVALLIFGPKKLPEIGRSLGKGIRDFKNAVEEEPKDTPSQIEEKATAPEQVPEPKASEDKRGT